MIFFWIAVAAAVLTFGLSYALYFYTFRNSPELDKRMTREDYLHSPLFHQYSKEIKQFFSDFDSLDFKRVYIRSRDGLKLAARYIESAPGAPLCILMHGYRGEAVGDFCAVIPICRRLGYSVLLPDQRASGISEGRCQTFGIKERLDTLDWIKYARKRFGEETPILLIGISMGAATVLMTSSDVPDNVKGIFADCAYTSVEEIIISFAAQKKLPGKLLYPFIKLGAKVFGHFDTDEESPEHAVSKTKVPICLIHGYSDDIVPYVMCGRLYDACPAEKYMVTVDRAGHASSVYENPLKYEKALVSFADKVIGQ